MSINFRKYLLLCFGLLCLHLHTFAGAASVYLKQGWALLVQDQDVAALDLFSKAYETAIREKNTADEAEALLYLGIGAYGSSYTNGLDYATKSMAAYRRLEKSDPGKATEGRSRCLQLISTIYLRQGKIRESIGLSQEALAGLPAQQDSTGTLGLIFNSLGAAYTRLQQPDSASYFHQKALEEHRLTGNMTYLPVAYIAVGKVLLRQGERDKSMAYFREAEHIADSTHNRQLQVLVLLAMSDWYRREGQTAAATQYVQQAREAAAGLSDRSFYLNCLEQLSELKKQGGDISGALALREEMLRINDSLHNWEKDRMAKSLETQFHLAEKDRSLELVKQEHQVTRLTNYILWGSIVVLLLVAGSIISLLRRINRRDKELLLTREELAIAATARQQIREEQIRHELEFKESQLSALTLQMLQKNELMLELKEKLDRIKATELDSSIGKTLNQGLNQDKEWADFNTHFESINKNFYTKLKQQFPGISPNDLRICALIKLNLSSKDMSNILNISADSVKTARYRLRKKLQLHTEDNLTEFIMNL